MFSKIERRRTYIVMLLARRALRFLYIGIRKVCINMKMTGGKKFIAILDNDKVLLSMFAGILLCSIIIVALAVKAAFLLVA